MCWVQVQQTADKLSPFVKKTKRQKYRNTKRQKYELDPGPGRADKLSPFIRLLPVRLSIDDDEIPIEGTIMMKMLSNIQTKNKPI